MRDGVDEFNQEDQSESEDFREVVDESDSSEDEVLYDILYVHNLLFIHFIVVVLMFFFNNRLVLGTLLVMSH